MDNEQIKHIIQMTILELKKQGMIKSPYNAILKEVEPALRRYFARRDNKQIERFLIDFSDDIYIDILYLSYRDGITIDRIAELMNKDVSTIKRNKKRLIMTIYDEIDFSEM